VIGSPQTAHRISISDENRLRILDIQSLECLLDEPHPFLSHCFSLDGSRFAACYTTTIYVWEYDSGHYALLGKLQCYRLISRLQFSPTSSSILGCADGILRVWRLHELPTSSGTRRQYVGLSRSWTHIATAYQLEKTITITDLLAQNPPQFIDTNMQIEGMVITGNVLLVAGSGQLVAWLLTEDGLVDGVIGDRRVGRSDSIWAIMSQSDFDHLWRFRIKGQVGIIELPGNAPRVYDTETGEVLPTKEPQGVEREVTPFAWRHWGLHYLRFYNLHQRDTPPGDSWKTSEATLREGWVKDAEGKHRLWVPAEWRADWNLKDWRHDVTTQFSCLRDRLVLIKF